jgi:hypothetical protein
MVKGLPELDQVNWMKIAFSRRILFISGILTLISQVSLWIILSRVAPALEFIRQQTTLSPEEFDFFVNKWGPQNMQIFLSHYYLDFIHPILYSVFLGSCIYQLGLKRKYSWLVIIPFLAGLCDEIENLIQLSIHLGWLSVNSFWFYIAAGSSRLKWLFVLISFVIILIGFVGRRFRHRFSE